MAAPLPFTESELRLYLPAYTGHLHWRKFSAILLIGFLQPSQNLGIHLADRSESNFKLHVLMQFRGPQASSRLLALESHAEIETILRRCLQACERSSRRHERDISFARLDDDLTKRGSSVNDGVQDRSEMWPIRILRADKLLG